MNVIRKIIAVLSCVLLAVSLIGAGFVVCIAPPVTGVLANLFSDDATSPFSRSELVQVAQATRDYSFGAHDEAALYRQLYEVDKAYAQKLAQLGATLPKGFPDLSTIKTPDDTESVKAVFASASEMYCFSPETVSHLDDCYDIARIAYPLLAVAAVFALACLIAVGVLEGRRTLGRVLAAAGLVVVVGFIALGVGAVLDFNGLFALFHGVFFSQGSWVFPYDSLLICALPTAFWMGMGAVWLAVSAIASILSFAIGFKLTR